jgi:protein deglycase
VVIAIILAEGFEEIEAITVCDVLRRADLPAKFISLDEKIVIGAHQISTYCDYQLPEILEEDLQMLVLPGGEPGTTNLENDERLAALIKRLHSEETWLAAICAAPRIFDELGVLTDKPATNYPAQKDRMVNCQYQMSPVVVSDHVITSRGPGTALRFALTLVEKLCGPETSNALSESMLVPNLV